MASILEGSPHLTLLTTFIHRKENRPRKISDLLSTHSSFMAELGLEFMLWGYQVKEQINWTVLSKTLLCILVSSFTKWEESYSGSSRVDAGPLDPPYFLAAGKSGFPVPACEDFSFTRFFLWSEQSALPSLDFRGWSRPAYEPTSLAAGWGPSHTQKQCYLFICVSSIFSIESSFGFLMCFWKKGNLLSGHSVLIFCLLCS